jgi:hypothetical protein
MVKLSGSIRDLPVSMFPPYGLYTKKTPQKAFYMIHIGLKRQKNFIRKPYHKNTGKTRSQAMRAVASLETQPEFPEIPEYFTTLHKYF